MSGITLVIIVLGALELALDVVALVILVRTPRQRVTLPKWAWALIIILINLIGAILFLAIGRRPAEAVDPRVVEAQQGEASLSRPSASSVADSLYGDARGVAGAAQTTPTTSVTSTMPTVPATQASPTTQAPPAEQPAPADPAVPAAPGDEDPR
jgi:hypothetical protein